MHLRTLASTVLPGLVLAAAVSSSPAGPFYGDPPDEHHPWAIHDDNRPQPPRVEPGTFSSQDQPGQPPSDAVVLFDGTEASLANWRGEKDGEATKWEVKDGVFQCKPGSGYARTKAEWADCQLHVEWSAPSKVEGNSQGRGNSGIFPMGQVEVQVLDNFDNPTYADGFAGSVYGVNPPFANALRKPGEWQVYDIVFRKPVYKDGKMVEDGYLTVFVNGVLTQDSTPLEGGGGHRARSKNHPFPEKGPLQLQDHGNPVRYRNIWYRPLPIRSIEGGTDGRLSAEATKAKRASIASGIREKAAGKTGTGKMLALMESLCYELEPAVQTEADQLSADFLKSVEGASPEVLEKKKGEIMQVRSAMEYLAKNKIIPAAPPALEGLGKIIKEQKWDEKH